MKLFIKYNACALLFILSSCGTPNINEKHAAEVVKKELALSGNVLAMDLSGGHSGAQLFKVTSESKQYVARFITNKPPKYREQEIFNLKVAENGGYGPQIYFSDAARGIIIMEYLAGKKLSPQDFRSDQFYVALAHLLQKIHRGKAFANSDYDVFKRINRHLQINKPKGSDYVPLAKLERVITTIHQALLPHLTNTVPCHNDLHEGNLIFLGQEFKAIDYENAGQNDPYFDMATVTSSAGFYSQSAHEQTLFKTYLERQPSKIENAKLYLMKQVVLIKRALGALNRLGSSPEIIRQYSLINAPSLMELAIMALENKMNLDDPETNLHLLKTILNQVFENTETHEFRDAVDILKQK
ncbi:MAG: choline/ethanolamine kinase family protein [bacterium]